MRTGVSLSATFNELPGLRDLLLGQLGHGVVIDEWRPRSDAVVFAQGAGDELRSNALVQRELDSTELLGTPVFLLSSPDGNGSTAPRPPWGRLRGRCVQIERSPRDRVTCLRLVDAIEDHLLHLDPGPEPVPASPALGTWLRPDLALAGISGARGEASSPGPDHPAEPNWPYVRFLELVRRGDLANALHLLTLPDGATPLEPWPAGYLLGRVRGARGWFDDLVSSREEDRRSAAGLLELAYWDLVGRSSPFQHQEAAERACLIALVRVSRRSARSEAPQWLRRLEQHLRDRPGVDLTPVVTEQIRLDGRYGVERSDRTVELLSDELWRSPARAERLLASQDLVPVHELADRALVQVVAQTVDVAARSVVQPAPAMPQEDLHEAVGAARAFAWSCAEALRRDVRRLDGLVEQDSPVGRWTVDQRERDLQRRRDERDRTRHAHDQAAVELARAARAAGIASELADPLNLPLPQRDPDTRQSPDARAAADGSSAQLVEAIDVRVAEVVSVKEAAHARRDGLLARDVGPPVPPTGARLGVGLLGAVALVVDLAWRPGAVVLHGVAGVLSLLVVAVCFLPWVLALAHRRGVARAQDAVAKADADHRAAVAARAAAASVGRADVERAAAELGERRASDRLAEAVIQRDQVAQQLGLGPGRSAAEFAQAFRDRLISFDRAFAEPTPFWWQQAVFDRSAADGDLTAISETEPVGGGLLSGVPGTRLVRAVDDGGHRFVSDLWAVFPVEERTYALAVERRLRTWLTPRG